MIIKSFIADSAASALKQVRTELGGDAIVLKTRRVPTRNGGHEIEITACLDAPLAGTIANTPAKQEAMSERRISTPKWTRVETSRNRISGVIDATPSQVRTILTDADFRPEFIDKVESISPEAAQLEKTLATELESRIDTTVTFKSGDRIVIAGMNGVGKTTVLGKLAAQFVSQAHKVTIAGVHQNKIGANDELLSLADLCGTNAQLSAQTELHSTDSSGITLIDSGELSLNANDLNGLRSTHRLLVVSALTRTTDIVELAHHVKVLGITHVVMTMSDLTHRLGGVISTCDAIGAKLVLVNNAPSGIGRLSNPSAQGLAQRILSHGGNNVR